MKLTIKTLALVAVAAMAAVACKKNDPQDIKIVGDFSLTAENGTSTGWIEGDKAGIFVTSDGLAQVNLPYTPSEFATCKEEEAYGMKFKSYSDPVGNVALNADGTKAGYKKGTHTIYAYCPYNADAKELTAVPCTDIANADNADPTLGFADPSKNFCVAKKVIEGEYSAAPVDLGKLEPKYIELNTGSLGFEGETAVGKTIIEVVISAAEALAYPTYDLEKDAFSGEGIKSLTIKCNLPVESGYLGPGTIDPVIFYSAISGEKAIETDFTFTAKASDGTIFTGTAKPQSQMGMYTFRSSVVLK